MILGVAKSSAAPGHPLWHFGVVAGAAIVSFLVIKIMDWSRRGDYRITRFFRPESAVAALGLASSGVHGWVCPEHFHEWVLYGVFFMTASIVQAGWSAIVFLRPNRRLLLAGAAGNSAVIALYFVSRSIGIPFGPDAFHPETFDTLSMVATVCEAGVVVIAASLAIAHRAPERLLPRRHAPEII